MRITSLSMILLALATISTLLTTVYSQPNTSNMSTLITQINQFRITSQAQQMFLLNHDSSLESQAQGIAASCPSSSINEQQLINQTAQQMLLNGQYYSYSVSTYITDIGSVVNYWFVYTLQLHTVTM